MDLYYQGKPVIARGNPTREFLNVHITVKTMQNNILFSPTRNLNYKFMVAEWLWIWFGLEDVKTISQYNNVLRNFSDDGEILAGAYGTRLAPQVGYVQQIIERDHSTRQAVMTIFSPAPGTSKDIPCTLTLQIFIRDGAVHAIVNMRSSDIWLGLPYDFFTFSMYVNALMTTPNLAKYRLGSMSFNLGSSHLYETNVGAAEKVLNANDVKTDFSPRLTSPPHEWLKPVLQNPGEPIGITEQPWRFYAAILNRPKEEAISHLRALSHG
jgi:thymidylate synthase